MPGKPFPKGNNFGRRWVAGQSGNPHGRPRIAADLRERAKGDAREAYEKVLAIMRTDGHKLQLAAAVRVLQVAGVPMSEELVAANPGTISGPAASMSDEALDAALETTAGPVN